MADEWGLSSGDDSPWSSDVPAPPRPDPHTAPTGPTAPSGPTPPAPSSATQSAGSPTSSPLRPDPPELQPTAGAPAAGESAQTSRRIWVLAAAMLTVAMIGAIGIVAGRTDDGGGTDGDEATAEATGGSTPSSDVSSSDVSSTNGESAPTTAPARSTTTAGPTESSGDPAGGNGQLPDVASRPTATQLDGTWVTDTIELPDVLASLDEPTTIVALTQSGGLAEIDLPSGDVSRLDTVDRAAGRPQFLVGRSATLVSGITLSGNRTVAHLYERGRAPVEVGVGTTNVTFAARPGTDDFVGLFFGASPDDLGEIVVSGDGTVAKTPIDPASVGGRWPPEFLPTGERLVADGGSWFAERADGGFDLVTTGELLSVSSAHALARECTASRACATVLIEAATGNRRQVQVDADATSSMATETAQVSPDGSLLWFIDFLTESEWMLDLRTGERFELGPLVPSAYFDVGADVWLADSSGVLRLAAGELQFVDAATGETTSFGEAVGPITAFGLRYGPPPPLPSSSSTAPTGRAGLEIAGYSDGPGADRATIVRLDTGSSELVNTEVDALSSSAPVFVITDDRGISAVSWDNVDGVRVQGRSVSAVPSDAHAGPMVRGPSAATLWVPTRSDDSTDAATWQLVDGLGDAVGPSITMPANAAPLAGGWGSDGTGDIIVQLDTGDTVAQATDGFDPLTRDDPLAIGPNTIVSSECLGAGCTLEVTNRTTGRIERISDGDAVAIRYDVPNTPGLWGSGVSADGSVAAMSVGEGESLLFVHFADDQRVFGPPIDLFSPVIWADDGSEAVYLSRQRLHRYDRASGTIEPVAWAPLMRAIAPLPPTAQASFRGGPRLGPMLPGRRCDPGDTSGPNC